MVDDDDRFMEEFAQEINVSLHHLEDDLSQLKNNAENHDALNNAYRTAHTITGSSGMMGVSEISGVSGAMENVFQGARENLFRLSPADVDILCEAHDAMKTWLLSLTGEKKEYAPKEDIVKKLNKIGAAS